MNANLPSRLGLLAAAMLPLYALASSHREVPAIAGQPRVDGTDFLQCFRGKLRTGA